MYISIDIGGTNTRVVLYNNNTKIKKRIKIRTNVENKEETLDEIVKFVKDNLPIDGIGISAPGPSDYRKGVLLELPNLPGWRNFDLLSYFKENTGVLNIMMENDANLMALANHHYFGGTKEDVTQFFTISTGLGSGLIIENKIFQGSTGFAQEIANAPLAWKRDSVKPLGEGALESFASGSGILYKGKRFGKTTKEIFANKDASFIIDDAIETLANLIATSAAMLNPSLMIFDGSVARHHHNYINSAIKLAKERMYLSQYDAIDFKFAELEDDSALLGAYYLIKDSM